MPTPRYTLLRVVAYVLELLAATVLITALIFAIASIPGFGTPPASQTGEVASPLSQLWFFARIVLPYPIGLYAAAQLIFLVLDTRRDVDRLARRLAEFDPPERS